ncbi:MAG: YaaR family protein [Treponemataceae bacterium]
MNNIDSLNSSLYLNAVIESSKNEAKKLKKERKEASSDIKSEKTSFFSKLIEQSTQNEISINSEIPEIAGMDFEQAKAFLIDEVYSMGEKLKQKPVQENFAKYKKAIGNFLKFVENQCYEVEDFTGIRPPRKSGRAVRCGKKYKLIKVVNEKLDTLAADILYNQKDQIKMAAKINEIEGLLVDFFC